MYLLEGDMTAFQIAEKLKLDFKDVVGFLDKLHDSGLIERKRIPIEFDR
jgi:DNA-binding MarR family transcriptional regulator